MTAVLVSGKDKRSLSTALRLFSQVQPLSTDSEEFSLVHVPQAGTTWMKSLWNAQLCLFGSEKHYFSIASCGLIRLASSFLVPVEAHGLWVGFCILQLVLLEWALHKLSYVQERNMEGTHTKEALFWSAFAFQGFASGQLSSVWVEYFREDVGNRWRTPLCWGSFSTTCLAQVSWTYCDLPFGS